MPINYIKGDLFSYHTKGVGVLVHACNCKGTWGAGIAKTFRTKFPSTYEVHKQYCHQFVNNSKELLGKCQLIKSSTSDVGFKEIGECYIGCIFTSDNFGDKKLSPKEILKYTEISLNNLCNQLKTLDVEYQDNLPIINLPKINAGLFGVPWEETEKVLLNIDLNFNVYYFE